MKPEKTTIKNMREEDLDLAMEIKDAEGWNQTRKDWELLFASNPELCLVGAIEGQIIATVTAITYEEKLAWIGMMLVRKEHRGKGIAKLLMDNIIKKIDHCPSIKLDATPAGFPVYSKLGFVREYIIYRMTNPDIPLSFPERQDQVRRAKLTDLEALVNFDGGKFGVKRKEVIKYLLANSPNQSWLVEKDQQIYGFLLGRPGTRFFQLGPLIAESSQVAIQLMSKALPELQGRPLVVDVLQDKEKLIQWLHTQGFSTQRELIRMYYKENPNPGKIHHQYLISGPELG
jgi:ribosomal protein S18 acetylase RimI-like enzyme